jgi:hypothetical protein
VGSLVLVLMGTAGAWNPWALVWVERLFHHTFVFGVLAALGFFFGLTMLLTKPFLRLLLIVSGVAVAVIWALFGVYASTFDEPVVDTIPAPSGSPVELVVRSSSHGLIDPAWVFEIRQTGTPWARYWEFGCMSGDAPENGYKTAHWKSRDRLVLKAEGGKEITMKVDPSSAEPTEPSGDPWTCSGWR